MTTTRELDPALLRRIAVGAAGLDRAEPFGRGRPGARRALQHLGYVQIDTISVVRRAHEHVLLSRVPRLAPAHLDELVRRGEAFEYWAHAAAYLPIEDFRHALPRMHRLRAGDRHWMRHDPKIVREVLERIRAEGPLQTRDFEQPAGHRGGWWSWKPAKIALERLFHEGHLMIVNREGFAKTYDLTERALPDHVDRSMPSPAEHADHLVERARATLGVFTARHVTHLRREQDLRTTVAARLDAAVEAGRLVRAEAGGTRWFVDAERLARPPRVSGRVRLLSPFDNLTIHRDRLARLFDFDYQLECYVPAAKRRYGYFALPILAGSRLVGRADCRADRRRGVFELRHLALETDRIGEDFAEDLTRAAFTLADQDACDRLRVGRISGLPRDRARTLKQRLEQPREA
ncbi:MAG TPA: crosslink repair DNA glycosylase YcaQ family protein [Pseudomonadales bacterium]|nr:crosslink repair DNA glycosylase YcaQ family protein [Pseudomonadales bacterium]